MDQDPLIRKYLAAHTELEQGAVEQALRKFEHLTLDAPEFAPGWVGLGQARAADGDLDGARPCFRRAMRLDRRGWGGEFHWGVVLHRSGSPRDARRWLTVAARKAPDDRRVLQALALCLSDLGDWKGALRALQTALSGDERFVPDAELLGNLGDLHSLRGDYGEADAAFQRACLLRPNDAGLIRRWAQAARRGGDLETAVRMARLASGLEAPEHDALVLLIELAFEREDWAGAEAALVRLEQRRGAARLSVALGAEKDRLSGQGEAALEGAVRVLQMEGAGADPAVDLALGTLRALWGRPAACRGFRLLVRAVVGDHAYYRPYVVLAPNEGEAREAVEQLQSRLDTAPWEVLEVDRIPHRSKAQSGVYQVLLSRVLLPLEE
jgi:tetratricopeptide (TPR) repeat protein